MSKAQHHEVIRTLAGGSYALAKARQSHSEHTPMEFFGGLLAGNLAARFCDLCDLLFHPAHRSLAHGLMSIPAVRRTAVRWVDGAQAGLRAEAERHAVRRAEATTPLRQIFHGILESLCLLAAGGLAGLLGGYDWSLAVHATLSTAL